MKWRADCSIKVKIPSPQRKLEIGEELEEDEQDEQQVGDNEDE